ncbi:hypothetical protein MED222_06370 [Vibrio sp. MED222]|nr:hypothetical protein MED222_06370 [Vibrio sp. MED222]
MKKRYDNCLISTRSLQRRRMVCLKLWSA